MARGKCRKTVCKRKIKERAEFDVLIAGNTGVGGKPRLVILDKRRCHAVTKGSREVAYMVRDAKGGAGGGGLGNIKRGRLAVRASLGAKLHGNTRHRIALF